MMTSLDMAVANKAGGASQSHAVAQRNAEPRQEAPMLMKTRHPENASAHLSAVHAGGSLGGLATLVQPAGLTRQPMQCCLLLSCKRPEAMVNITTTQIAEA